MIEAGLDDLAECIDLFSQGKVSRSEQKLNAPTFMHIPVAVYYSQSIDHKYERTMTLILFTKNALQQT